MDFVSLGLHPDLLKGIHRQKFDRPTPIQADAIPPAMAGRDLLACAMTGSGKTAAFLLPILHRLRGMSRGTTRALVLSPTRELAAQIDEHREALASATRISGTAVFGGVGMRPQEQAFRRGVDVLVATPGRLLDHMQYKHAKLTGLEILVLDEADRMLDMGFLPDIRRILKGIPQPKQTILCSATMPREIVKLAGELLRNPARINVERKAAPATGVLQSVYPVQQELKSSLLLELLTRDGSRIRNALVFTRTKHRANRLAKFLVGKGVPTERIHGNRSQAQRTQALAGFKRGRYRVLVATDIAARGIDIDALSSVVNFDVPKVPDDYIHRVGRTARAESVGDALTFFSPQETKELRAIERAVGKSLPQVKVKGFDYSRRGVGKLEIPLHERLAAHRAGRKAGPAARKAGPAARRPRRKRKTGFSRAS